MIYRRAWPTRHELEMEVFSFIEAFYNPLRRHSRLGNLSPAAYEHKITTQIEMSVDRGPLHRNSPEQVAKQSCHRSHQNC